MVQRTTPIRPEWLTTEVVERFNAKTREEPNGCLTWTGHVQRNGYGTFGVQRGMRRAHRVAYVLAHGHDIPPSLQIDHLCRNRACVNPDHLEVVTLIENIRRGVGPSAPTMRALESFGTCKHGHDMAVPGAWIEYRAGHRQCRQCYNENVCLRRNARKTCEAA